MAKLSIDDFLDRLSNNPAEVEFEEAMGVIDGHYSFNPTAFKNGDLANEAGQNNGSSKIFAFGLLQALDIPQTLACFGKNYRIDVLENPDSDNHQNIRNFMRTGWTAVSFEGDAPVLSPLTE